MVAGGRYWQPRWKTEFGACHCGVPSLVLWLAGCALVRVAAPIMSTFINAPIAGITRPRKAAARSTNPRAMTTARNSGIVANTLTSREREGLQFMAEGEDNTAIAATLVTTERTVSKHIGNVFLKLGLPPGDAGHAVRWPSSPAWKASDHSFIPTGQYNKSAADSVSYLPWFRAAPITGA